MEILTKLPLLSIAIALPIAGGVLMLLLAKVFHFANQARQHCWQRQIAHGFALLSFLVTLPIVVFFNAGTNAMQFVELTAWIPYFRINYHLGVDGISLWFIPLTAFMTWMVLIVANKSEHYAAYSAAFLILSGLMIGVFCALDAALFYVFFEATLIPMYIIIGVWGGPRRVYAAYKFFLYTLAGSLLFLLALIYLYLESGSQFYILGWHEIPLPLYVQQLIFIAFFAAFAVKVPMWPLHTWLPDAHVEAPTEGSVILAAIMLKLGAYGFLRFALPITPDAAHYFAPGIITLSLIAVVYVGLVALVQTDMKKLVAYSSVAHMGFVTLGFFLFDPLGVSGGIVQMISHGFVSGAMFFCIGVLYDRVHSREIASYGGVVQSMPKFAAFALLFTMANAGLPATSGFVGEWMVILSAVSTNFWLGFFAATTLILAAAYSLWMYKRVYFGVAQSDVVKQLSDINMRETIALTLLAVMVVYFGVHPRPLVKPIEASVQALVQHVQISKIPKTATP